MGTSIREFLRGIKARLEEALRGEAAGDFMIAGIVVLVGFGGFGLGRLSFAWGEGTPVTMTMAATTTPLAPLPLGGRFVASRSGTKYYYPWCGGAKSIAAANLIWFDTAAAAEEAGYAPASNCKGLAP